MTSYVEYHGYGFWGRNLILREWLLELVAYARQSPDPWRERASYYWEALASALRWESVDICMESAVRDEQEREACVRLLQEFLDGELSSDVRRSAGLALALLRGKLSSTRATALDYWSDEEWLDG